MRICSTSDIHVDEHNRLKETEDVLDWMATDFETHHPDLITIAGDSFPVSVRPSTPTERKVLQRFFRQCGAIAPTMVIRGNHDIAEHDLDIFGGPEIHVFREPAVVPVAGAVVGVLPWPSKGFLMASLPPDTAKDNVDVMCRQAMASLLRYYTVTFSDSKWGNAPRILISHLNVTGSKVGGFALVGQDVEVSAEDLERTGADLVILGHIHMRQSFGDRVKYSGSPRRVDFGEEGETKGYLVHDVAHGQIPTEIFRETPLKPMQTITVNLEDPFTLEHKAVVQDAELRLLITVAEEEVGQVDLGWIQKAIGAERASSVHIPPYTVISRQRVRAPEMQTATTDADMLRAYLNTLDPKLDEEIMTRVLMKFEELAEV